MNDYQTPERMELKRKAIPLPDLAGKTVLDIGCDHGYWCWLAADLGASHVLGVDRNRDGIDLITKNTEEAHRLDAVCAFSEMNVGKQWRYFGKFDVVFLFSLYHHIYQNCGDHRAIWFWLWQHTSEELLWENPTGDDDAVVRMNVTRRDYDRASILRAASIYFDVELVGPALHVATREVWRCIPKTIKPNDWRGQITSGSPAGGGATRAFEYASGRRIDEIEAILGVRMFPGTLNLNLDRAFDWDKSYYRAQLLETVDRSDLSAEWKPRWARFYPVIINNDVFTPTYALRFEGETYRDNYLEVIAPTRLLDSIESKVVDVRS